MNIPIIDTDTIEGYEVYRVVLDYQALHEGFVDRVDDLQVTRNSIDEVGGFASGYSAKVLCNPPMKFLGRDSLGRDGLGKMLKATGMALIMVIDDARFAPIKDQMAKRKRPVHPNGSIRKPGWLITREASQNMQILRNKKLSPKQRKSIARRAARARWKRKSVPVVPSAVDSALLK